MSFIIYSRQSSTIWQYNLIMSPQVVSVVEIPCSISHRSAGELEPHPFLRMDPHDPEEPHPHQSLFHQTPGQSSVRLSTLISAGLSMKAIIKTSHNEPSHYGQ